MLSARNQFKGTVKSVRLGNVFHQDAHQIHRGHDRQIAVPGPDQEQPGREAPCANGTSRTGTQPNRTTRWTGIGPLILTETVR